MYNFDSLRCWTSEYSFVHKLGLKPINTVQTLCDKLISLLQTDWCYDARKRLEMMRRRFDMYVYVLGEYQTISTVRIDSGAWSVAVARLMCLMHTNAAFGEDSTHGRLWKLFGYEICIRNWLALERCSTVAYYCMYESRYASHGVHACAFYCSQFIIWNDFDAIKHTRLQIGLGCPN